MSVLGLLFGVAMGASIDRERERNKKSKCPECGSRLSTTSSSNGVQYDCTNKKCNYERYEVYDYD